MNKKITVFVIGVIAIVVIFTLQHIRINGDLNNNVDNKNQSTETIAELSQDEKLKRTLEEEYEKNEDERLELIDITGNEEKYTFTYKGEKYFAIYTPDNWKIIDSYKISNRKDITKICEALIEIHQIHGLDYESYRTAEDMAYEWVQHNIAYTFLPDDNKLKNNAKDVDLNPDDQGKTIFEMYEARTGKS